MSDIPVGIWVGILLAMLHMWLCHMLLERVKRENTATFHKMGEFHLFLNNTPRSTGLFWKWLCSSAPTNENDGIVRLAGTLRILTVVVLAWFVVQATLIW